MVELSEERAQASVGQVQPLPAGELAGRRAGGGEGGAAPEGRKPPRTRVFFRWVCHSASDGEEVRVVGGCPELGDWEPARGHVLARSVGGQCWVSKEGVKLRLGRRVEYRYAVCNRQTGKLVHFEPGEGKRYMVPTGLRHILEDDGGRYRTEVQAHHADTEDAVVGPALPEQPKGSPRRSPATSQQKEQGSLEVTSSDVVFLVFRLLPLTVQKNEETGEWDVVKLNYDRGTVLPMLHKFTRPGVASAYDFKVMFVGHPGVYVQDKNERRKIAEKLAEVSCIPVFVDEEIAERHISFCEDFLYPVFHNKKIFDTTSAEEGGLSISETFDQEKWRSFMALNNAYSEAIEANGTPETLVWIHDYELVLVPRYLYLRCPSWTFGLFLHCAFPSSEVLRCLPNREEILQSMLSSRLVTFQIFDYMRNFMSCCSELVGARHSFQRGGILQVEHENKSVVVAADHFAIPYSYLVGKLGDERVQSLMRGIREQFRGKTIIASHDRCDCFAGLALKLRAFHRFLSEYKQYQGSVVLVQYVSSHSGRGSQDRITLEGELQKMAAETNQAFGRPDEPPVVTVCVQEMDRDKRLALLLATDILLDTSINDGLNLTPFIFYAAHSIDQKGVAIVSEFCGCSSVLTGVFKVNPWNTNTVMTALDQALSLQPSQRALRYAKDHSYVSTQTLVTWVSRNLTELKGTRRDRDFGAMLQGPAAGLGTGAQNFQMLFNATGFQHLAITDVLEAYRKAKNRVLLLDNEGTIASKAGWYMQAGTMTALKKQGQPPDPQVLDCLQSLVGDRGNTVVVCSGRDPQFLDRWFGGVEGLGLSAEYGFYQVFPRSLHGKGAPLDEQQRWRCMRTDRKDEWKESVSELMKLYVRRVQGSIIEHKGSGITWNYREVGGQSVVRDLALELARFLDPNHSEGLLHGYPVKVAQGKGYVEVKRSDVDKGTAVTQVLEMMTEQLAQPVDFVLCIGDDRSDEDMFEAVNRFFQRQPEAAAGSSTDPMARTNSTSSPRRLGSLLKCSDDERSPSPAPAPVKPQVYTVTVGRKPSRATYFLGDVGEVSELLQKLAAQTIVSSFSRFSSMPTLQDGLQLGLLGAPEPDGDDEESAFMAALQPAAKRGGRRMSTKGL